MIKNSLIVLLALVAIGVSVLAWRQYEELVGLRAAAMDTTERADFQKRVWDSEKRARLLQTQLDAIRSHAAESGELALTAPADAAPAGNAQNRMISDAVNGWLNVMNDPEAQRLMALQQRGQISSRYAGLFRALGLPADKLAQFKELLLEKQTVRNDVLLAATQQGINPLANPQEFRQLENSMQAEIDAKIKATLGPDGFAEFQSYQQTQGQRGVVNQLQESLTYTATPLSTTQSERMVEILGRTGPPRSGNGGGNPNNSTVTDATIAAAQSVLAPPQVETLKEIQQQQQAGAELQKLMRQGQGGGPMGGLPGALNGAGGMLPGRGVRPGG
jgi:hypothetical protein